MRTLVHLSDLHFGRIDHSVLEPLISVVNDLRPDIVAVSGDLTQRARSAQFREARQFLDRLPRPQIIVPGNHDVPMHNVFARFAQPLHKYRQYITRDLEPFYADDEIAVLGLNTARSLTVKYGRINRRQVDRIRERLCSVTRTTVKVIVTHHPFHLPVGHDESDLIGRARMAMETLARCGADLLLAGHIHLSHTLHSAERYKIVGHSALVVSAGTATSTRVRGGEPNSFNVLRLNHPRISVERMAWDAGGFFKRLSAEDFEHTPSGWKPLAHGS